MKNLRVIRYKRALVFSIITMAIVFSSMNVNYFIVNSMNDINNNDFGRDDNDNIDIPDIYLKNAGYESNRSGTGAIFDITAHQSYKNNTFNTNFLNLSASGSFTVPCPVEATFNSSNTYIKVEGINAPNKTLEVEKNAISGRTLSFPHYTSFVVPSNSYLTGVNVSLYAPVSGATFTFDVYSSQYSGGYIRPYQDLTGAGVYLGQVYNDSGGAQSVWLKLDGFSRFLNTSNLKTYNNTFFIWIQSDDVFSSEWWGDNVGDDTISYNNPAGTPLIFDLSLIVDLGLNDNTPTPQDIDMKINDFNVINGSSNDGFLTLTNQQFKDPDGNLDFEITAGWWDVNCTVTEVQINYTKTDLMANSAFRILGSGQDILWNITVIDDITSFDIDTPDFNYINFTIPSQWTVDKVYNGGSEKNTLNPYISGANQIITALEGENGNYWYLNTTSSNLLFDGDHGILTKVGSDNLLFVNYTNTIELIANFTKVVQNPNGVNISIYNSSLTQIHSDINNSFMNSQVFVDSWTISNDVINYGMHTVHAYWSNTTDAGYVERNLLIMGETELSLIEPADYVPITSNYFDDDTPFNVTLFFNDTSKGGIAADSAKYINETESLIVQNDLSTNGTDGYYHVTINPQDFNYGEHYFTFIFNESYCYNQTFRFRFNIVNRTNIYNWSPTSFTVKNFDNSTFSFLYNDSISGEGISGATISNETEDENLIVYLKEDEGDGNYSISVYVNYTLTRVTPYWVNITVEKNEKESQVFTLWFTVVLINTTIDIIYERSSFYRYQNINYTTTFYYNRTYTDAPILDLTNSSIMVYNNAGGSVWSPGWTLIYDATNESYVLNVSVSGLDSGDYSIKLNMSVSGIYNWSTVNLNFVLLGNSSTLNTLDVFDQNGQIITLNSPNNYTWFKGRQVILNFTLSDETPGSGGVNVIEPVEWCTVRWYNSSTNAIIFNTPTDALTFNPTTQIFEGQIDTSGLFAGDYSINITIKIQNYEQTNFSFYLTIREIYNTRLVNRTINPSEIIAGTQFNLTFNLEYFNDTDWLPLQGVSIILSLRINGIPFGTTAPDITNINGTVSFLITVPTSATSMQLTVIITAGYYYNSTSILISDISVTAAPPGGIRFEDILFWIILIGVVAAGSGGVFGVYRGMIVPKKRARERILSEVQTIFDDAVNLEHVLVLYKNTGMCVFFKSFGLEEIDPELISGFLSAVSSFGKEMESTQALNEIRYGDKQILLSDGEYIRVALVLGKKPSIVTRHHLSEFITAFEKYYSKALPDWRGNLKAFQGAGRLVDSMLNTSIILPHEIKFNIKVARSLKKPNSKEILKIAQGLVKDSERQYFFIGQLLTLAVEKLGKEKAEVFIGIKELRDSGLLAPIEITAIETPPISQQELDLISQKVNQFTNLSENEKQKLVSDIAAIRSPVEREAYISSLAEHQGIVSRRVDAKRKITEVKDDKAAKKEIAKMLKKGQNAKKGKDYKNAIQILSDAAEIALNWELQKVHEEINDEIRVISILDLEVKMKNFEDQAKKSIKTVKYKDAANYYKLAADIASKIFKLGRTDATKEVKRLTNKSKEYEKLAE